MRSRDQGRDCSGGGGPFSRLISGKRGLRLQVFDARRGSHAKKSSTWNKAPPCGDRMESGFGGGKEPRAAPPSRQALDARRRSHAKRVPRGTISAAPRGPDQAAFPLREKERRSFPLPRKLFTQAGARTQRKFHVEQSAAPRRPDRAAFRLREKERRTSRFGLAFADRRTCSIAAIQANLHRRADTFPPGRPTGRRRPPRTRKPWEAAAQDPTPGHQRSRPWNPAPTVGYAEPEGAAPACGQPPPTATTPASHEVLATRSLCCDPAPSNGTAARLPARPGRHSPRNAAPSAPPTILAGPPPAMHAPRIQLTGTGHRRPLRRPARNESLTPPPSHFHVDRAASSALHPHTVAEPDPTEAAFCSRGNQARRPTPTPIPRRRRKTRPPPTANRPTEESPGVSRNPLLAGAAAPPWPPRSRPSDLQRPPRRTPQPAPDRQHHALRASGIRDAAPPRCRRPAVTPWPPPCRPGDLQRPPRRTPQPAPGEPRNALCASVMGDAPGPRGELARPPATWRRYCGGRGHAALASAARCPRAELSARCA